MRKTSAAFTLVELLVVIAIIGILVALLLPAVQTAREAARRMQCTSGAKNIALAILNYESAQARLPRGRSGCDGDKECRKQIGGRNPSSGLLQILPYLEEQPLYDRFDEMTSYTTLPYPDDEPFPYNDWILEPGRADLMAIRPAVYRCPSDSSPESVEGNGGVPWSLASYALVSGSLGVTPSSDYNPMKYTNDGLFHYRPGIEIRRITDGMSKTLMVGEKRGQFGGAEVDEIFAMGLPLDRDNAWQIGLGGRWGLVNTRRTINHSLRTDYLPETAFIDFVNSSHPGGANVAFGDGRVELLSENIDLQVYWALGTRQGPLNCDGVRASYIEGVSPGCGSQSDENHNY